jgi:hypothetical protein
MTEPLRISVEIAREMLEFDIHESPYAFKRTGIAHLVDERVKPLVELLKRSRHMLEATGYQHTTPTIVEIDAALKDAGVE